MTTTPTGGTGPGTKEWAQREAEKFCDKYQVGSLYVRMGELLESVFAAGVASLSGGSGELRSLLALALDRIEQTGDGMVYVTECLDAACRVATAHAQREVAREREACASIADDAEKHGFGGDDDYGNFVADEWKIAEAIRARGGKGVSGG